MKKDTQVRYLGGVKSPILTEVKKSDKVTVLEDEDDWMKVATADGYVGYIKTKSLKNQKKEKHPEILLTGLFRHDRRSFDQYGMA